MKKLTVAIFAFFAAGHLLSQEHYNAWFRGILDVAVSNKVSSDVELQYRRQNGYANRDMFANNLMLSSRIWVHYVPTEHIKVSVSPFAGFYNYTIIQRQGDEQKKPLREMRWSVAAEVRQKVLPRFYALNRAGVEYRAFNSSQANIVRARDRVAARYHFTERIAVTVSDELMLNLAGAPSANLYDQNRIGVDFEYKCTARLKFNIGYIRINRLLSSDNSRVAENNAVLNFTFIL